MRPLGAALREILEAPQSDDPIIVLVELSHEILGGAPIRLANNTVSVTSNGEEYVGWPFEFELPSDDDSPPRGVMTVQNVDIRIGQFLRSIRSPMRLRLMAVVASSPDSVWLDYRHFWFRNIRGNDLEIQGDVDSWDFATEPWPNRRMVRSEFPGLYI